MEYNNKNLLIKTIRYGSLTLEYLRYLDGAVKMMCEAHDEHGSCIIFTSLIIFC